MHLNLMYLSTHVSRLFFSLTLKLKTHLKNNKMVIPTRSRESRCEAIERHVILPGDLSTVFHTTQKCKHFILILFCLH